MFSDSTECSKRLVREELCYHSLIPFPLCEDETIWHGVSGSPLISAAAPERTQHRYVISLGASQQAALSLCDTVIGTTNIYMSVVGNHSR